MVSDAAQGATTDVPQRWRLALAFSVTGDLRFISHHDVLRMFRRAFARAGLPVRYSQGFNPHPRMTIPVPRPVGVASLAEAIVVTLDEEVVPEAAMEATSGQMPEGLAVTGARLLAEGEKMTPAGASYQLPLTLPAAATTARAETLLARDTLEVTRRHPASGRTRTIDVRPYIDTIDIADPWLTCRTRITGSGTIRPAELATLLELDVDAVGHQWLRTEIKWQP